jgi:elongation factor P hydroxylase
MEPDARILERIFADCFAAGFRTVLVGGGEEPLYVPSADPGLPHRIVYREDYFASALHEVAHWCLAGDTRRQLEDYGYWYAPDGRDSEQQAAFERVESRPQALEWIFSDACAFPFTLSADNLEAGFGPSGSFRKAVERQRERLLSAGLPPRARRFRGALGAARAELLASADPTGNRSSR